MLIEEYQGDSEATSPGFDQPTALAHGLAELLSEAGEVADLIKRQLYATRKGKLPDGVFRDQMAEELGDVLWCVSYLASSAELDLAEIAEHNVSKLRKRWEHIHGSARTAEYRPD